MNDYIATELSSGAIAQAMRLLLQKKQELVNLKGQLQNIRNDAEAKRRMNREIKGKENEADIIIQNLFAAIVDDVDWMYKQRLCTAVSCSLNNKNFGDVRFDVKFDVKFEELWRNKIIKEGGLTEQRGILSKSLLSSNLHAFFQEQLMKPSVNLDHLPPYSFFLQFCFTLAKPYISRDDKKFYVCENPIRKDKVFGLPIKEGSSWKGNMLWTARKLVELDELLTADQKINKLWKLVNLFGHEREEKENLRKGRLHFYPTFFDKIGLEIINPHDRKIKSGKNPIPIETVPAGAKGEFSLLYLPFDLLGLPLSDIKKEVMVDLENIPTAIRQMMRTYGFSAKKSSGFGITGTALGNGLLKSLLFTDDCKFADFGQMAAGFKSLSQEVAAYVGR
jgi:CRISPR/Cas system CMR subunit Cmr6 (Cas7 group RAMP superfamily)